MANKKQIKKSITDYQKEKLLEIRMAFSPIEGDIKRFNNTDNLTTLLNSIMQLIYDYNREKYNHDK